MVFWASIFRQFNHLSECNLLFATTNKKECNQKNILFEKNYNNIDNVSFGKKY